MQIEIKLEIDELVQKMKRIQEISTIEVFHLF